MTVTTEHTVFPADVDRGLAALLVALETAKALAIETTDGQSFPLTPELRDILTHAAHALIEGHAVTLEPQRVVLSTQEAADLLGVSRPTLVKLLETGAIPYTQPGRHRRVQLTDLLAYQQQIRHERRDTLAAMNAETAADDAYGRLGEFGGAR
ncbi:helix-turn-helix domain-containing protein [Mycolicibacterium baixiangningiae]|uniref:helix-turn-helix domain-containing protein n=1 Tax=Mycolicibacterium baixiangningiae TaxID=2761578 RepID=UPI0018685F99|nr:helix-turn-helix domain-containing protein [Mycolicibacterium baixiangningiae]